MSVPIEPIKRTLRAHLSHVSGKAVKLFRLKTRRARTKIHGRRVLRGVPAGARIAEAINAEQPLLVSRFGTTESTLIKFFLENEKGGQCAFPRALQELITKNSGFYPSSDENLSRFCQESLDAMGEIDLLGVRAHPIEYQYWKLEDLMIRSATPNAVFVDLEELSPVGRTDSWTKHLSGRKVLVIHPFANTIKSQFKNKEKIFPNSNFLPVMKLDVIRAVQSAGTNQTLAGFPDWFSARDAMIDEIRTRDFDIALIGAGAYGLFLGAECRRLGKQAIHIGGATQLLFGILGRRWTEEVGTSSQDIKKHVNQYWVSAAKDEIPEGERTVEGGGYWV
jgi:hypothetical protein